MLKDLEPKKLLVVLLVISTGSSHALTLGNNSYPARELLAAGVGRRTRRQHVEGCSIYVLDLNEVAAQIGVSQCHLDDIVVDARTQVPYLKAFSQANKDKRVIPSPHFFSGNSAPWFTRQAVERSRYWSKDASSATVILVDDYCFKLWWLSYIHSEQPDQLPGEHLLRAYAHMIQRPEWQDSRGGRHVFFQSHTGFAHGPLGDLYERFLCDTLVNSMHIVNVRASRLRCKKAPYNPKNFLIAPGSVQLHDIVEFQKQEKDRLHNRKQQEPYHERDFLIFFKGKCTPVNFTWKVEAVKNRIAESTVNVGKLMRVHIVREIQGLARDVRTACTGDASEMQDVQNERPHWEQMDEFMRSTFCLLIPGDSQTSRRLPEAVMAGCIPVFPGPPYHTMPFANLVDYPAFALFYKFKRAPWADDITVHWEIDKDNSTQRPHHPTDAEWWVPDVDNLKDLAIDVEDPAAMVQHLRGISEEEVARKQQAVLAVQAQFAYLERSGTSSDSAADLVTRAMCIRGQQYRNGGFHNVQPKPVPEEFAAGTKSTAAELSAEEFAGQEESGDDDHEEQPISAKNYEVREPQTMQFANVLPEDKFNVGVSRAELIADASKVRDTRVKKRRRRRKGREDIPPRG